jgi:hypothetical protein
MAELIQLSKVAIEGHIPGPFFEIINSEKSGRVHVPQSKLELVCIEPITATFEQIKNKAHEELALNIAKKYNLPYVRLSEYCLTSPHPVQFIGGENESVHTYLAQFYRLK